MTKAPNKLSDTVRATLTLASTRPDRLVRPPQLPTAAARQVVQSLLNSSFNEEIPAPIEDAAYTWRATDDSLTPMLRPTDAGLVAAGAMPALTEMSQTIEASTQQVIGFPAEEGCNATIVEEAEVRIMLEDGFANGRSAGQVARDTITWLVEDEERAEEAQEAANAGATDADTANDDAVAREVAAAHGADTREPASSGAGGGTGRN